MTSLSSAELLDGLAARGVMLYLGERGELRARCEPCFAHILDAARPMIGWHRQAILDYLREARRTAATRQNVASNSGTRCPVPNEERP